MEKNIITPTVHIVFSKGEKPFVNDYPVIIAELVKDGLAFRDKDNDLQASVHRDDLPRFLEAMQEIQKYVKPEDPE
tara:strand:+ start:1130 stop:1357 length:228 start_codon:yes stop_codon:yes gene_type:complete